MPKGTKRRSSDRYEAFDGGERIPLPDYAMFYKACDEVGKELGIPGNEIARIYKGFIAQSLCMMFPEGNPRDISDEKLLSPRRIIHIPKIASLEVTERSLWHWHKVHDAIKNARRKMNNNTKFIE